MIGVTIKIEKPRGYKRNQERPPITWRQALVAGCGIQIRKEYQEEGDPSYSGPQWRGWVDVAPDMPGATKGKALNWGAYRFENLEEYHRAAGVLPGSFNVTGGMWNRGLSMVPHGSGGLLLFRGTSRSYLAGRKYRKSAKQGQRVRWTKNYIDNALKAWVVLNVSKRNPLEPSDEIVEGVLGACTEMVKRTLSHASGGVVSWDEARAAEVGHSWITQALIRATERGQTTI